MAFDEVETIWLDGEFVDWEDAKIHALSHVVHYGSGVFEGIRCYDTDSGPALFRPAAHFRRFAESAAALEMALPYDRHNLTAATRELITRNDLASAYVRPLAYYGYGSPGFSNYEDCPIQTMIAAWPKARGSTDPIHAQVSSWRRIHPSQVPTTAKLSGMYVNSILSHKEATAGGFDYSIMLNHEGNVAEGASSNLFLVRDGNLYTPGLDAGILDGVTRRTVMAIAADLGYEVLEQSVSTGELYTAEEVFVTGTSAELQPVGRIAGETVGDGTVGPVTATIQETFDEAVAGHREEYADWLTYV